MVRKLHVLVIAAIFCSSGVSAACDNGDYLVTLRNYSSYFGDLAQSLDQGESAQNSFIVTRIFPVCDESELQRYVGLFIHDSIVKSVGNSVSFDTRNDAEEYLEDLLSYLSGEFEVASRLNTLGDDGDYPQIVIKLNETNGDTFMDLSLVYEADFSQFTVYLENHSGEKDLTEGDRL